MPFNQSCENQKKKKKDQATIIKERLERKTVNIAQVFKDNQ